MDDCWLCGLFWKIPVIAVVLHFLRRFIRGAQFSEDVRADGLVAVVTGASSGIGRRIAEQLNLRGAKVYLMCRNERKTREVVDELVERGCVRNRLIVRVLDLTDLNSVRAAGHRLRDEEPKIDILVNNAGVFGIAKFEQTVDDHEKLWQSNYLGHFLLTSLLIAQLRNSTAARIVNVSSMLHKYADTVDVGTVDSAAKFGIYQTYNRSKVAMVMHCRSLAKRFAEEGIENVTANSCHPGCVRTSITNGSFLDVFLIRDIIGPLCWFFMKSDLDGAQTPLYVALSREIDGITGQYFSDCAEDKMGDLARNDAECEKLYDYSRRAVSRFEKEN